MKTEPKIDVNADIADPVVRGFSDYLDAHDMRKTPERYAILNHIMGINGHFTIEELQQLIEGDGFRVSRLFRGTRCEITVRRGAHKGMTVDGKPVAGSTVPLTGAPVCTVELTI